MAVKYLKFIHKLVASRNADYSNPQLSTFWPDDEITPDEWQAGEFEATAGGITLQVAASWASISLMYIRNNHATVDVSVNYTETDTNNNTQRIPPGRVLCIPDVDPAVNIIVTADSGTVLCDYALAGS